MAAQRDHIPVTGRCLAPQVPARCPRSALAQPLLEAGAREAFYRELDEVSIAELVNPRQVGPIAVQLGLRPPEQLDSGTPTFAI